MKKLLAILLSVLFVASLSACSVPSGQNEATANPDVTGAPSSADGPAVSGEISGEITVSAYDSQTYKAFLEDAARLFEEKYPGTTVTVETFSAMPEVKTSGQGNKSMTAIQMQDDPQGRQDYISKVNTAMMSGGGADVYAMDVLPIYKYAQSGQLEDLAGYMNADSEFDRAAYRGNILDAIQYNGGTWFLPVDYTFDYFAYDSTLISPDGSNFGPQSAFSTQQLFDLAKELYDGSTKLFNISDYQNKGNGGMWRDLFTDHYTDFVDIQNKTANFADGSFAGLLNTVTGYAQQGYIPQGVSDRAVNAEDVMRQAGEAPTDRYSFKHQSAFSLLNQFTRDTGRKLQMVMIGENSGIEADDEIAGIHANADGTVPFTYGQAYGINANSQNKQTAWAFIKFLLSEEMQINTHLSPFSFPVLNSALEKKANSVFGGSFMGAQAGELDEKQQQAFDAYLTAIRQMSDQIHSYTWTDTLINDMISAEVQYYFDGSKTAEEVADVLQNKVDLYLNE
jgi:multiple sugar transport system substrate-binding protein